jgi:hypothetical protein
MMFAPGDAYGVGRSGVAPKSDSFFDVGSGPRTGKQAGAPTIITPPTAAERCAAWNAMDGATRLATARRIFSESIQRVSYLEDQTAYINSIAADYITNGMPPHDPFGFGGSNADASWRDLARAIDRYCTSLATSMAATTIAPGVFGSPYMSPPGPGAGTKLVTKPSGAIADSPALPWLGGAVIGSLVTYFAMRKSKG